MSSRPTIVPKARLLHVELAHNLQSPGIPSHTQVREPQSAMRRLEQPPAMNQSGQPWNSGKRGPMRPAPLTSGGLTLEEITCRGWGPHLQYSFLINFFLALRERNGPEHRHMPAPNITETHRQAQSHKHKTEL